MLFTHTEARIWRTHCWGGTNQVNIKLTSTLNAKRSSMLIFGCCIFFFIFIHSCAGNFIQSKSLSIRMGIWSHKNLRNCIYNLRPRRHRTITIRISYYIGTPRFRSRHYVLCLLMRSEANRSASFVRCAKNIYPEQITSFDLCFYVSPFVRKSIPNKWQWNERNEWWHSVNDSDFY